MMSAVAMVDWRTRMQDKIQQLARQKLLARKAELSERLERIKDNVRRGHEADSKERAIEMENEEVVDALGNETQRELQLINAALRRIADGQFGICRGCGESIPEQRLMAQPVTNVCIDCAEHDENVALHSH
jgi:RNA polymerase-binding protein DksA